MCFSLPWIQQLLVWLVLVVAVVAIIRLFIPWLGAQLGDGGIIAGVLTIVLWAVVAIFVIYLIFALLSCVTGGGFPLLPRR